MLKIGALGSELWSLRMKKVFIMLTAQVDGHLPYFTCNLNDYLQVSDKKTHYVIKLTAKMATIYRFQSASFSVFMSETRILK